MCLGVLEFCRQTVAARGERTLRPRCFHGCRLAAKSSSNEPVAALKVWSYGGTTSSGDNAQKGGAGSRAIRSPRPLKQRPGMPDPRGAMMPAATQTRAEPALRQQKMLIGGDWVAAQRG